MQLIDGAEQRAFDRITKGGRAIDHGLNLGVGHPGTPQRRRMSGPLVFRATQHPDANDQELAYAL